MEKKLNPNALKKKIIHGIFNKTFTQPLGVEAFIQKIKHSKLPSKNILNNSSM